MALHTSSQDDAIMQPGPVAPPQSLVPILADGGAPGSPHNIMPVEVDVVVDVVVDGAPHASAKLCSCLRAVMVSVQLVGLTVNKSAPFAQMSWQAAAPSGPCMAETK
jgi:hypothetical protein